MKRYKSDPCRSCYGLEEAPDGDWVRYEDAVALQRQLQALVAGAEFTGEVVADLTEARDLARASAKAYHEELEALRVQHTELQSVLAEAEALLNEVMFVVGDPWATAIELFQAGRRG